MRRKIGYGFLGLLIFLVVAFLWFRTPDTDPAAMRAKYGGPPSQFVDLGGGLNIHLRDTGPRDAPVLMLIHGSNASLHTWEPWAGRLGTTYRIVRFDLPGHGLTGASPTNDYTTAGYVAVVEAVRAKLGIARMTLAGNSMGGGVAWHYALAHPDRVAALVLVDSAGYRSAAKTSPPLAFRIAATPGLRNLAAQITPRNLIASGLRDAFGDPKLADDAMIDRYWELLRYPGNRAATLDRFSRPLEQANPAQLAKLKMPVLILWGAMDRIIPLASGEWLHTHIPGSTMIVYPGTGHVPMEERPDRSATDVVAWMIKQGG